MTSNATSLHLDQALADGMLIQRKPLRPLAADRRKLYVTPEIAGLLNGGKTGSGFPDASADILVARYVAGYLVTVAVPYKKRVKADFERLDDVDEVWAVCFRKPKPGWRLLGRFLWREQFVGLRLYDRHELAGANYANAAQEVIDGWAQILGTEQPLRGTCPADYFDPVFGDIHEKA